MQEFQTKIDELNDKKTAILELPIDDEKKNELCADIDLEPDSLNLQLGREKSRKVMEFTTTDELSEKCRILKMKTWIQSIHQLLNLYSSLW